MFFGIDASNDNDHDKDDVVGSSDHQHLIVFLDFTTLQMYFGFLHLRQTEM